MVRATAIRLAATATVISFSVVAPLRWGSDTSFYALCLVRTCLAVTL